MVQKWWRGGDASAQETSAGPVETFAVRTLYDQFGREIYARAAADAAFSAAISEQVAELRELGEGDPQLSKILSGASGKVALDFYLLGHTHAVLTYLLEAALRPDAHTPASVDPDFAAVRLGVVFHLAFDGGLLQLPAQGDGPDAPRSAR
ncbi:hypothetical protein ACIBO5_52465 [Nonomuraea angiospora]|uniref:hypothetical protein n=1 Tax=Nonomuraea angiospora TaxID=46172 RepID=UPI0029A9A1D9|nr:hypothetical protein [Nonomuraea angiospora]MDX3109665.1 hypothetical protein [Nonomuraea angiospora]